MDIRRVIAMIWMFLGIPFWVFTEEGPVGFVAGKICDWWIEIADLIDPGK